MKKKWKCVLLVLGIAVFAWVVFLFLHSVYHCPGLTYLDGSTGYLVIEDDHGYLVNLNNERGHKVERFEIVQRVGNAYTINFKGMELDFVRGFLQLEWKKNSQVEFNWFNFKAGNPISVIKVTRAIQQGVGN